MTKISLTCNILKYHYSISNKLIKLYNKHII